MIAAEERGMWNTGRKGISGPLFLRESNASAPFYLVNGAQAIPLGISASLRKKASAEDFKRFQKFGM